MVSEYDERGGWFKGLKLSLSEFVWFHGLEAKYIVLVTVLLIFAFPLKGRSSFFIF